MIGQDLEAGEDGMFRIARKVAKDRVISTVDPETRHGHKTAARGFDGYKGRVAVDPDSEIITDTTVTPGNAGDASVAEDLIDDLLDDDRDSDGDGAKVYGDSAYGTGEFQERLDDEDIESGCRTQQPSAPGGLFTKNRFNINLGDDTVTCPNNVTVSIRRNTHGGGIAPFAEHCSTCPLRPQCTTATAGRTISVSRHEAALVRARTRQGDPAWQADYRATRPKVERKLGHLMRRRHGGRRARVRGRPKVDADFNLVAPQPTWRASPCSDCAAPRPDGRSPHDRRAHQHRFRPTGTTNTLQPSDTTAINIPNTATNTTIGALMTIHPLTTSSTTPRSTPAT